MTDILTSRAVEFIRKKRSKTFFLYIGHKAVHSEVKQRNDVSVDTSCGAKFMPAERHCDHYKNKIFPRRRNADLSSMDMKTKLSLNNFLTIIK